MAPRVCPEVDVPMDLDTRVPAAFAARFVGVSRQTFRYWRTSGKLTPDEQGRYRLGDVLNVERDVRRSGKSHRGPRTACPAR